MTTVIFTQNAHRELTRASLGALPVTLMNLGVADLARIVDGKDLLEEIKAVAPDEALVIVVVDAQQASALEEAVAQIRSRENTEIVRLRVGFQATPAPSVPFATIITPEEAQKYLFSVLEKYRVGADTSKQVETADKPQEAPPSQPTEPSPAEVAEVEPKPVVAPVREPFWRRFLSRKKEEPRQEKALEEKASGPLVPPDTDKTSVSDSLPSPSLPPAPPTVPPSPARPISSPAPSGGPKKGREKVRTIVIKQPQVRVVATPEEIAEAQEKLNRQYGDAITLVHTLLRHLHLYAGEEVIVVLGRRNIAEIVPMPGVHVILVDEGDLRKWLPTLPEEPPPVIVSPRRVVEEIVRKAVLIATGEII